jgi:hypothetical protein
MKWMSWRHDKEMKVRVYMRQAGQNRRILLSDNMDELEEMTESGPRKLLRLS